MCTNACRQKGKPAETLPADSVGHIPAARGHREGFGKKRYVSDEVERFFFLAQSRTSGEALSVI